jgi:hypothetical protein
MHVFASHMVASLKVAVGGTAHTGRTCTFEHTNDCSTAGPQAAKSLNLNEKAIKDVSRWGRFVRDVIVVDASSRPGRGHSAQFLPAVRAVYDVGGIYVTA